MKNYIPKIFALFYVLFHLVGTVLGQEDPNVSWGEPRPQDLSYYNLREKVLEPPYGLVKVKKLIKKRESSLPDGVLNDYDGGISEKDFNSLTLEEKFTYTMLYPEIYSQACAEFMYIHNPQNRIFGNLPLTISSDYWSKRQLNFFNTNKSEMMRLIRDCVMKMGFGGNFKNAIVEMNGWELIPFIIDYYAKNPKDKDCLTVLMTLMKKGKYSAFESSKVFVKLYGNDSGYFDSIHASSPNESFILESAKQYFDSKKKK